MNRIYNNSDCIRSLFMKLKDKVVIVTAANVNKTGLLIKVNR